MAKEIKSYKHLLGKLDGISDTQLEAHFGLYEGYVRKLNEIEEKLTKTDRGLTNYSFGEYAELKRRYAVPYNGAFLHELYFDNLGNGGTTPSPQFEKLVYDAFGGMDAWKADAKATGLAVPGWVITSLDTTTGRLFNLQIMEHHIGYTLNMIPLMIMDTWEHAFFVDYKANRGAYIDAFFKNVNWGVVNERTAKALGR
jgi:superoxide dismutase, Fe-Mn family